MSTWQPLLLPDLDQEQIGQWLSLLEKRTGISFEKHQRILQAGLKQRMQEVGVDSYADYYAMVTEHKQAAVEWTALLRTLTVKETRFWRDPDALEFLRKYLHQRLPASTDDPSALEIWSVASSTGEEPYTLAMIVSDVLKSLRLQKYFGITATDICLSSLSIARKGIYPNQRLFTLQPHQQQLYFKSVNERESAVVDSLKERVCFVRANIIDLQDLPVSNMDIIYCQNVLIYFKHWRQKAVLNELVNRLKPNGLLIVGMGEALNWENEQVVRVKDDHVQAYIKVA